MSVTDATAVIRPPTTPVSFIGSDREFRYILLRGALLLIVTLGIYRFWLTNDIRRFLWANTEIDGRPLEYSGTAIELLHGFLVAFAIILPIYTLYFVTALELSGYSRPLTYVAIAMLVRPQPIRNLSGAALSPDPHRVPEDCAFIRPDRRCITRSMRCSGGD